MKLVLRIAPDVSSRIETLWHNRLHKGAEKDLFPRDGLARPYIKYEEWITVFNWVMSNELIYAEHISTKCGYDHKGTNYWSANTFCYVSLVGESSRRLKRLQRLCGAPIKTQLPYRWFEQLEPRDIVRYKLWECSTKSQ